MHRGLHLGFQSQFIKDAPRSRHRDGSYDTGGGAHLKLEKIIQGAKDTEAGGQL